MFLKKLQERNQNLLNVAIEFHQKGLLSPDTYLLDVDTILDNAKLLIEKAKKNNIKLYAMTKQIGRIPFLAKKILELGYSGVVAVDFKEAEIMIKNNIPLGNVGHLVQAPTKLLEEIIKSNVEIMTVYSYEKIEQIDKVAKKLNKIQNIMLRVLEEDSIIYSGQSGGFYLNELEGLCMKIKKLKNIKINGLTSFPCYLYDKSLNKINPTKNVETIKKAKNILSKYRIEVEQLNFPSATSLANIKNIRENGGTHGEPGHALTGTTPFNAYNDEGEKPAILYLSEVSHNLRGKGYFYGGGYYRRSGIESVLVGNKSKSLKEIKVTPPTDESIDYYFELNEEANVGDTVLGAFRTQIFVTRSDVALIGGMKENKPYIIGIYDSLGREK
ncbi:alanine racemase [Fusobacterium sp.]|uniref:alanine racemase n=1 Tax=Fusobacterium sp. TaxID=68766 RepID=UPI002625295E|nr:alanine racemase [Fusobacterium sp.]